MSNEPSPNRWTDRISQITPWMRFLGVGSLLGAVALIWRVINPIGATDVTVLSS